MMSVIYISLYSNMHCASICCPLKTWDERTTSINDVYVHAIRHSYLSVSLMIKMTLTVNVLRDERSRKQLTRDIPFFPILVKQQCYFILNEDRDATIKYVEIIKLLH